MFTKDQREGSGAEPEGDEGEARCAGFKELEEWQVNRYRKAVEACRAELSHELGRCVGWFEAERHFYETSLMEVAEQWRHEYCGLICPHKTKCLLALQFLGRDQAAPLYHIA